MGFIELTTGQWRCERCGKRTEPETKQIHMKPDGWEWVNIADMGMYEARLMCAECVQKEADNG